MNRVFAVITVLALALTVLPLPGAEAQGGCVSLTTAGSAYTQDFDMLSNVAASITNNLTITGWFLTEAGGGARDNEQYGVDTGGSATGDTYSYGAAASTDRALGGLRSGTLIPIFGACFTNNTGVTITNLAIDYTGEQWRYGNLLMAARSDQINFEYSTDATDLTTGTWTSVTALNFVTPNTTGTAGSRDGNANEFRTGLSSTISGLSIPPGATFRIRWIDANAMSADDGLAVDDFSLTPNGAPVVSLSIADVTQIEGNSLPSTFRFTVSLSGPDHAGVTFDIATADDTAEDDNPAAEDNDYVAQSLTGQTIAAGNTTYQFDVMVNGDTAIEADETFVVNVSNVTGATVTDGQGQGTITNDDFPILSIDDVSQVEGNTGTTTFRFTVSLSDQAPTGGVTFDIATADGSATSASGDFVARTLTGQTIPAGSSSYTFDVAVNGDGTVEPNETFLVNVTNIARATPGDTQGVGTIQFDDLPILTINDVSQTETNGSTTFSFTVSLSDPAPANVTLDIATQDSSATIANNDYAARSLSSQTITSGNTSYTFVVTVNGDTTVEPDEVFLVNVANVVGATPGDTQGQGTIQNDDSAPALPTLTITDVAHNEGNVGTITFTFTVSLSSAAGAGGVTFDIATADGVATVANSDYVARPVSSQTIAAGSQTFTFDVTVNGDTAIEASETFLVNVTDVEGATVVDGQGQGTVQNDDSASPVLPNLTINDVAQVETNAGTTTFTFTVSLSSAAGPGGVTFSIATADGTAQDDNPAAEDNDYAARSLTGQTIPAGQQTYTFDVTVNGDAAVEPNETFFVNVSTVTGANVADGQGVGTITNDDSAVPGVPNLTINDVTQNEGDVGTTTFTFTASLSAPAGAGGVTFDIATANNTATAGSDFTANSATGQTIGAGSTSTTFNVTVNGDTTVETSETFFVNMTTVVGANVVDGQGVGTITEDDGAGALSFTSATAQVAENAGSVTLTVQRGGVSPAGAAQPASVAPSSTSSANNLPGGSVRPNPVPSPAAVPATVGPSAVSAVTVQYATANGTATAGLDFTATTGTLSFGVGETTKTIVIPILPDAVDELPETFTVTLSDPIGGATLGAISAATVTITDVDTTPCQTTLSAAVPAGSNVLPVVSQAGCNVGDTVAIDPGLPNEDRGTILGFGSIVIQQPTTQAHLAGAVVIRVTGGLTTSAAAPPVSPGDDSADDERVERERETEEERRQRARTNQGNKDDDAVEGDVLETRCDQSWPSVIIANLDGTVEVRLIKEAQAACTSIQVGDYLEADGEKQHEGLFHADSVEIKRRR